ncbi:MAG: hypothetical protein HY242_16425 [Afipia sp.]|nr:hypothetical protein [Afipia sp.]
MKDKEMTGQTGLFSAKTLFFCRIADPQVRLEGHPGRQNVFTPPDPENQALTIRLKGREQVFGPLSVLM